MNEVTKDLRSLAELELPPQSDTRGRNIVKITILCFAITILGSLVTVTYALVASINRENDLQNEIGCVRTSAVLIDRRLAEGLTALIDNDNILLSGLHGIAVDDPVELDEALANFDLQIRAGELAQTNLAAAIVGREQALLTC